MVVISVEDVNAEISSVAANLHQINLQKDLDAPSVEEIPAVIIPDHLLVTNVDCSHLSFGSFNSGIITAGFSGSFSSKPMKTSLDVAPVTEDTSSIDKSEARYLFCYLHLLEYALSVWDDSFM